MKALIFNGNKFASLSATGAEDFKGFYRKHPSGNIALYKANRELEALIVNNDKQGKFVVSASTNSDGKPFYNFSTCSLTAKWLGIDAMTCSGVTTLIQQIKWVDDTDVKSECKSLSCPVSEV